MAVDKFSQNLRTRIAVVPETVWGETPATPAMALLPVTAFGLNLTRTELKDQSIRADRMQRYSISGNSTVGGDIGLDLSDNATAQALLASAMKGEWTGDILKVGTTQSSFTIEQGSLDTSLYSVYTGVVVDSASIVIGLNDVVKATFSLIGQDMTVASAPLTGATYGEEPAVNPFTHFAGTIKEGGAVCGYLSQVQFDIASGSQANFALGDTFAKNITYGLAEVTGTATAYFKDNALLNKFLNGTASSIETGVNDGAAGSLTLKAPNIKYTSVTKQISNSGSITLNMAFTCLYDATAGSPLVITRT